jgi:Calx-beta domain
MGGWESGADGVEEGLRKEYLTGFPVWSAQMRNVVVLLTLIGVVGLSLNSLSAKTAPWTLVFLSSVTEGDDGTKDMVFEVRRIGISEPTTLTFRTEDFSALAGTDYVAKTGSLALTPDQSAGEVRIQIIGDTIVEPRVEEFRLFVEVQDSNEEPARGFGTIYDNDDSAMQTAVSIRGSSILEGNSGLTPIVFTVTRGITAPPSLTLNYQTVSDSAISGLDFESSSGSFTLSNDQPSFQVRVNVIGDRVEEPLYELIRLNLSEPSSTSTLLSGTSTIEDDDGSNPAGIQALPGDATVFEPTSGQVSAGPIVRLMRLSPRPLSINYSVNPASSTATFGVDYLAQSGGTLTIPAGSNTATIPFEVLADSVDEPLERIVLDLTAGDGILLNRQSVVLTIAPAGFNVPAPPATVVGCHAFFRESDAIATVLVQRINSTSAPLNLTFNTLDGSALAGSDYSASSNTLTWAPGNVDVKRIEVPILPDSIIEQPEVFFVELKQNGISLPAPVGLARVVIAEGDQLHHSDFTQVCNTANGQLTQ